MREGRIVDEVLLNHGLPPDTDPRGNVVPARNSDCISRQRAQNLTHQQLVQERWRAQQAIRDAEHADRLKLQVEHRRFHENSAKCEALVLAQMAQRRDVEISTLSIGDALLADFDSKKITKQLLEGFIRRRDKNCNTKKPPKGSAQKVLEGVECLIGLAFDCRGKPLLTDDEDATSQTVSQPQEALTSEIEVKPRTLVTQHQFVPTANWYREARQLFFDHDAVPLDMQVLTEQSVALWRCLVQRNEVWRLKIPQSKESHVIFSEFLPANLPVVAALLVASKEILDDVGRFEFRSNQCLFKLPTTCEAFRLLVRGGGDGTKEAIAHTKRGAYLFFARILQYLLRDGKASKTFAGRYGEHLTASKLERRQDLDSNFYTSCPHKDAPREFVQNRICYFSELDCYMMIGYDNLPLTRQKLCGNTVFVWPMSIERMLAKKHGSNTAKIMEDKLELIDYLLEHCGELCLDPTKDISRSKGWEKYML